jgi:hypothetical protein
MPWTYEEIEREWLGGSRIAVSADEVVAAFERCEQDLGRDWIIRAKRNAQGSGPTLDVVTVGQYLASIEDIPDSQRLIVKLRGEDKSALAELRAIYLLRSHETTRVELEPAVGNRKCDFRIQREGEPWVYVEVTRPDVSDAHARVDALLASILKVIEAVKKPFALEVFLRRLPADDEVAAMHASIFEFCSAERSANAAARRDLSDEMGILFLNEQPAGLIVLDNHGEEPVSRLSAARAILGPGEPNRHVAVRVPYADVRAEEFLRTEAKQLPTDSPGLIIVEIARAPGAFRSWRPSLQRRFQPAIYTRVGGVLLFTFGLMPSNRGEGPLFDAKLIANGHGRMPLPAWIEATCQGHHQEFEAPTRPAA